MIELLLPMPPSLNRYYRSVKGRVLISAEGREYRDKVIRHCMANSIKPHSGKLACFIEMMPPDNRRRDLDNVLKGLLDALQHGGAYHDDSQIDALSIKRGDVVDGGAVKVRIVSAGV